MPPAYFSVVMATGIVAMASYLELNLRWLASVLTILNAATFVVLAVLMITRAVRYPRAVYDDLKDFNRGPGFFAIVAGTVVLGSQMLVIFDRTALALAFWVFAIPIWAGFTYAIFTEFTINEHKPRFEEGMNGGWLISVVATQSIADLGARLSARYPFYHDGILFFALALWLAGGMLYLWLISLIFYRFTFFRFRPQDFIPPFWINMGAMAISTLAGTTLIAQASTSSLLQSMLPFLKGFTLFFWATATWWIPMLAILAYWQHVHKKLGRTYTFLYLGCGFSAWNVHRVQFSIVRSNASAVPNLAPPVDTLHCVDCLAGDVYRYDQKLAPFAALQCHGRGGRALKFPTP